MKKLNKKSAAPIYYQIACDLKKRIISGELPLRSKLPPEETLANEYEVARLTLRRAFDKLSQEGFLKRRIGKGSFVPAAIPEKEKCISILLNNKSRHIPSSLSKIISGAVMHLRKNGCAVRIDSVDELEKLLDARKNDAVKIDGMIALRIVEENHKVFEALSKAGMPFVSEGVSGPFSWVEINNEAGMEKAFKYLLELGHREIGIGSVDVFPNEHHTRKRFEFAKKLLEEKFGEVKKEYCFNFKFTTRKNAVNQATKFLQRKKKPTALLCTSDLVALPLIAKAPFVGVSVPNDISIVGFEDMEACEYVYPALTSIRQDYLKLGRLSAEELLANINDCCLRRIQLKVEPELIVRDSCKAPRKTKE